MDILPDVNIENIRQKSKLANISQDLMKDENTKKFLQKISEKIEKSIEEGSDKKTYIDIFTI